jgi:hypothetical protein
MPSSAKVGSWLENSDRGAGAQAEAYDSSSGSSDSDSDDTPVRTSRPIRRDIQDVDESEDEDEEEQDEGAEAMEDIDWEKVLPKLRKSVVDPSNVRRRAFLSRYLQVSSDCELPISITGLVAGRTDPCVSPSGRPGPSHHLTPSFNAPSPRLD